MTFQSIPGKRAATASLILGLIATILFFLAYFPLLPLGFLFSSVLCLVAGIVGIVGVTRAVKAKRLGFAGDRRLAGFALSLLGLYYGFANMISQFF